MYLKANKTFKGGSFFQSKGEGVGLVGTCELCVTQLCVLSRGKSMNKGRVLEHSPDAKGMKSWLSGGSCTSNLPSWGINFQANLPANGIKPFNCQEALETFFPNISNLKSP